MARAIVGAVAGYAAIFVIVFAGLSAAWVVMGADGAFKTATWNVTTAWVVAMLLVGIVAAIAGGWVSVAFGRQGWAAFILAGIVFVFGLLELAMTSVAERGVLDAVRLGDVGMFDAMRQARTPTWFYVVNTIVGVCGVLLGGRLRGGSAR